MVETTQILQRLDRLEQDHRDSRDILIEIRTQLENVNQKIDVHNDRINKREVEIESLEERVATTETTLAAQEGAEKERKDNDDKRLKKWGIIIIGAEIIVASIIAVAFKLLWN